MRRGEKGGTRVTQMQPLRLPSDGHYATGWYRVAWSHEIPVGGVLPSKIFGRDVVIFRGKSGTVNILDAYCAHLGAHLGYGGTVSGDCVRCPFHAWEWDGNGANSAIPDDDRTSPAKLGTWSIREVDGVCLVWFDETGREPFWIPGPILPPGEADQYFPLDDTVTRLWPEVNVYPQSIVENVADAGHFKYIHGSGDVPDVDEFSAEGPAFHSRFSYKWGVGHESTWLTPDGPIDSDVRTESWGMGIVLTRYFGIPEVVQFTSAIPVQGRTSTIGSAIFVRKENGATEIDWVRRKLSEHLLDQPTADLIIWENMRILPRPLFRKSEVRIYGALREWASGFYPGGDTDTGPALPVAGR